MEKLWVPTTPQQALQAVLGPNPDYTPLVVGCVHPALVEASRTNGHKTDNRFWDFYLTDEHHDQTCKAVQDAQDILEGSLPADLELVDYLSCKAKLPRDGYETAPVQTFKTFMTWLSKLHRVYEGIQSRMQDASSTIDPRALVTDAFKTVWPAYSDWEKDYAEYSRASRHKTHFILDDLDEVCECQAGKLLFVKDVHSLLDQEAAATDQAIASRVKAVYRKSSC